MSSDQILWCIFFFYSNLQWFAEMKLKVRLGWFLNVSMLQECYLYINYMCQTCACLIVSTKMLHALSNREYNLYLCHVFWTFSFSLTLISENCDVILYRLKMKAECAQWNPRLKMMFIITIKTPELLIMPSLVSK